MSPTLVIVLAVLVVMNLSAFILMGYDKRCAKNGSWRVPEKVLFLFAILFGALGGTAGMFLFRHKTKHWYFKVFFPLLTVLQAALLGYIWSRGWLG